VAAGSCINNPSSNPRLRAAVDKALSANMTKDTIERAIKRGSGADGGAAMEELRYEGYGPGGIALIIDCFTDNQTRTVADVRAVLNKNGGNLGTSNSVAFQFTRCGELVFATGGDEAKEEKVLEAALEAGADDVINENGESTVICAPEHFESVQHALIEAGLQNRGHFLVMRGQQESLVVAGNIMDGYAFEGIFPPAEIFRIAYKEEAGLCPEEVDLDIQRL